LASVSTWQSLVFLFARLPIGIFAFLAALTGLLLAPITATMSLHVVNGAANLVSRINAALLQPWDTGTATPSAPLAAEPLASTASAPSPATPSPAESNTAGGASAPFTERAGRAAATFTDRVQAVTDEISER